MMKYMLSTFVDTIAQKMYDCVCTPRTLFARVHAGARLRACCGETLAVVGAYYVVEMPQERLCGHVLGENVVRCVDVDNPHKIVLHQLLDEKVFEFDVFCFL